jgi:hypothetical protein
MVAGSSPWVRWPLLLWMLATFAALFFIPTFDFGFDGVVFCMAISVVMLLGLTLMTLGLRYLTFLLRRIGRTHRQ